QTRTAPGLRLILSAKAEGPPLATMISAAELPMLATLPQVTSACKMPNTRSNVSARNVVGMDENWRRLEGSWERLIWARERWQKMNARPLNAADAAVALQMKEGTYRAYERPPSTSKHTSLGY